MENNNSIKKTPKDIKWRMILLFIAALWNGCMVVYWVVTSIEFGLIPFFIGFVIGIVSLGSLFYHFTFLERYHIFRKVDRYNEVIAELEKKKKNMEEAKDRFLIGFLNLDAWEKDIVAARAREKEENGSEK